MSSFRVYEFSKEDALLAAKLDLDLEKNGKKIKRMDILIASTTTIKSVATLCTFDNEFQKLEELELRLFQ